MPNDDYKLPDEVREVIHALADAAEMNWRSIARLTAQCIAQTPDKKMLVYKAVANDAEKGVSTIRLYHQMESTYGQLLDTMPNIRFDHLRLALVEARTRKVDVETVIHERLKESDKFGGRLPPPDVWRAQIANGFKAFDWEAAFGRVGAQLATLLTHSTDQPQRRIEAIRRMMEEWEACDEVK